MANPDPIANAISLLAVLVTPNPAPTSPVQGPSTWVGSGQIASTTSLDGTIGTFVGLIFHASSDMLTASKDINAALTTVANVVGTIATKMPSTATALTDVNNAMTALQNSLSLAQSLAPAGATVVLNSASGLFQQLQAQLSAIETAGGSIDDAVAELAQLSQLLTSLAGLFPTS